MDAFIETRSTCGDADAETRRIDAFMMSVLKSRFEAIVREMTLVVMRASRSAVIKNARDFSCAILTYEHELVTSVNSRDPPNLRTPQVAWRLLHM